MCHFDAASSQGDPRDSLHAMLFRGLLGPALYVVTTFLAIGCKGNECVAGVTTACSPLYPPTFDEIYTRTLSPTCAQPGAECHGSAGVQGGLFFTSEDSAFSLLLGHDGHPRVISGDPSCSLLVERLYSTDPHAQMPPGAPLSDAERCSIIQWIQSGAQR
jgi:hypothetical protein